MKRVINIARFTLIAFALAACSNPSVTDEQVNHALYIQSTVRIDLPAQCENFMFGDKLMEKFYIAKERAEYEYVSDLSEFIAYRYATCALEDHTNLSTESAINDVETIGLFLEEYVDAEVQLHKKDNLPPKVVASGKRALLMLTYAKEHGSKHKVLDSSIKKLKKFVQENS